MDSTRRSFHVRERDLRAIAGGFTLIELMITVAIIAVLAAIAMPLYQDYVVRARLGAALADIRPGESAYESQLVANNVTSFEVSDVGLPSRTPHCSAIRLVPGETGHIECVLTGHPLIEGGSLMLTRSASGSWSCSTPAGTAAKHRPAHCS